MISFIKRKKLKVFCIGLGKTGTTSIEKTLKELGFKMGDQRQGELLIKDWGQRNFSKIIKLCYTADAFQDVPFCLPYTYQALDQEFSNAKFILTKRDNPMQWFNSLTNFHSKLWADGKRIPTEEDLKNANYLKKGWPFLSHKLVYDTPKNNLYQKDYMINFYNNHLYQVKEYFRHRPGKLLEVNIADSKDYFKLCEFLNKKPLADDFPWLNKSQNINDPNN